MTQVKPAEIYVETVTANPRWVRVKAVFPAGSDWVPSGMAFVATAYGERDVRLRATKIKNLHTEILNSRGEPWRTGYVRQDCYAAWKARMK